ncbi:MAG TPA: hypothetical protein VHN99_06345 [Deinococcales bacterium]|nr:hypothetical protein [Deinococcales bacterium]
MPDERPRQPLAQRPHGYLTLENYSSLKRFWDLLAGLRTHGFALRVPQRSTPESCRRVVEGLRFPRAGGLLDADALRLSLLNEDGPWALGQFTLPDLALEAVTALLDGEAGPLREILDAAYELHLDVTLGFTRDRQLIAKAASRYWPLSELNSPFPLDFPLTARRFADNGLRTVLDRAATGAYAPRPLEPPHE